MSADDVQSEKKLMPIYMQICRELMTDLIKQLPCIHRMRDVVDYSFFISRTIIMHLIPEGRTIYVSG